MSLRNLTYVKTLFEAALFMILVPLILWEVFKSPRTAGKLALAQGPALP
jgi:hypothetical protein